MRLTHERIQRLDPADLNHPITVVKGRRQGRRAGSFWSMASGSWCWDGRGSGRPLDELSLEQAGERDAGRLDKVRLKGTSNCTAPI